MHTIDKVAWTPIRDRKVLFARSKGKDVFYTVGGKREIGETDEQTLARETQEEASLLLNPSTVKHIHTFLGPAHGRDPDTQVKIACYDASGDKEPMPSNEIEELAWLTTEDKYRTTETGVMILDWFSDQNLIDYSRLLGGYLSSHTCI